MLKVIEADLFYCRKNAKYIILPLVIVLIVCVIFLRSYYNLEQVYSVVEILNTITSSFAFLLIGFLITFCGSNFVYMYSNKFIQHQIVFTGSRKKILIATCLEEIISLIIMYTILMFCLLLTCNFVLNIDYSDLIYADIFRFGLVKYMALIKMAVFGTLCLFVTGEQKIFLLLHMTIPIYFMFSGMVFVDNFGNITDNYFLGYITSVQFMMTYEECKYINISGNVVFTLLVIFLALLISLWRFEKIDLLRLERKEFM